MCLRGMDRSRFPQSSRRGDGNLMLSMLVCYFSYAVVLMEDGSWFYLTGFNVLTNQNNRLVTLCEFSLSPVSLRINLCGTLRKCLHSPFQACLRLDLCCPRTGAINYMGCLNKMELNTQFLNCARCISLVLGKGWSFPLVH